MCRLRLCGTAILGDSFFPMFFLLLLSTLAPDWIGVTWEGFRVWNMFAAFAKNNLCSTRGKSLYFVFWVACYEFECWVSGRYFNNFTSIASYDLLFKAKSRYHNSFCLDFVATWDMKSRVFNAGSYCCLNIGCSWIPRYTQDYKCNYIPTYVS